ncbi:ARF1 [Symbiodinium sp. CCMP2592]|nr:ARF1 [Symbiodinium sp. CCMP2592]
MYAEDGIRDVEAMSSQELVEHKSKLVLTSLKPKTCIKDPKRLQSAVGNLWSAWLAVVATLSLKFAQTTAYALAIAEMLKYPVTRYTAPVLAYSLGPDLVKWVDVIIDSVLKAVLILIVWIFAKMRPSPKCQTCLQMHEVTKCM